MPLSGSTSELSLFDLVQVQAANGRSCSIRVRAPGTSGVIYLAGGEIVHAVCGDRRGEEALGVLLAARDAVFEVERDGVVPARTIFGSWQHALLEAARRNDERSVAGTAPVVPPLSGERRVRRRTPPSGGRTLAAVAVVIVLLVAAVVALEGRLPARRPGGHPPSAAVSIEPTGAEASAEPARVWDASELTGAGDALPVLVEGRPPRRPPVDLALSPTIPVRLRIGGDGRVEDAAIYRSRLDLRPFEDAALEAARAYRFVAARHAGRAVPATVNWPVVFAGDDRGPTGLVRIKGSDTIGGALAPRLAEAYRKRRPDVAVPVEALGSSTAFAGLFDGSAEIGASSRPISRTELAQGARLGVRLHELVLGYDGIAIIVHRENPVRALAVEDVARLFNGEVATWRELGGPDAPIVRLSRPSYSGTHAFFAERILGTARDGAKGFAADTRFVEESAELVRRVAAEPGAVAYVGLGTVTPAVTMVALAPGRGAPPVAPGPATVRDGSYPLYRPLLLYTRGAPAGATADFLRFVFSAEGQALVAAHGFVPVDGTPPELLADDGAGPPAAAPEVVRIPFTAGTTLDRAAEPTLALLAARLRGGTERVLVVGHADWVGDNDRNRALALRRARVVAAALRARGVAEARLAIDSASEGRPVATNETTEGRRENRRVDVYVVR